MDFPELPPEAPRNREPSGPASEHKGTERITPLVVNCTRLIADVRTLHAATFAPFVLALTFLLFATPMSYITGETRQAAQFLVASLALSVRLRSSNVDL